MAMLAIDTPDNITDILKSIFPSNLADHHITLFHLGDSVTTKELFKIIPVVKEYLSSIKPFEVSTSQIFSFPKGEDGFPVVCKIDSPELIKIQKDLKELFKENDIYFSDKYPDYKPHLTLTYSDEKQDGAYFDKIGWFVSDVVLYTGSQKSPELYVSFPIKSSEELKVSASYMADLVKVYLNKI